jgi:hypothetical protein
MNCGEDMVVALNVDFQKIAHWTEAVENAEPTAEEAGAPIISVEANFIVPEEERHKDLAFPRLTQLMAMTDISEKHGSLISVADIPEGMFGQRPSQSTNAPSASGSASTIDAQRPLQMTPASSRLFWRAA